MTVPVVGRHTRRLDGYCSNCQCLTSEEPGLETEIAKPIACWYCGSLGLDFSYRSRNNVSTFYQGGLLSEILSGERLPFDDVSGKPTIEFTVLEDATLPPEYQWLWSIAHG